MSNSLRADLASLRIDRSRPPPRRRPRRGAAAAIAALTLAAAGFVGYRRLETEIFMPEVRATAVGFSSPNQGVVVATTTGYVVPQRLARVGVKAPATIARVLVAQGDRVEAGAALVELDSADQKAALSAAGWQSTSAKARAAATRAGLAEVSTQIERERALVERGITGRAHLEDLRARAASLQLEVKAAEAEAKAAVAKAGTLEAGLKDRVIAAPIGGTVINRPPVAGEIVGPQDPAIIEIVDLESLVVETDVPEARLEAIRLGSPCEVALDAFPSKRLRGKVLSIGKRVNRAKATIPARVELIDRLDGILPDMGARVTFLGEPLSADALQERPKRIVPPTAVVDRPGGQVVFVIDEGRVRSVPVRVGSALGSGLELLDGPEAGTRIVSDPPAELSDGQRVREADG